MSQGQYGSSLFHAYPMSGVLSAGWRFDWVGVLEHADSAWEELANFSRSELVRNTKLDSSLGAHPTSHILRPTGRESRNGGGAAQGARAAWSTVQFAACRLRLLRLRHTGMPRRPRPPISPSPRDPIRDVSSGSTEGFRVLEQAGARSAWRLVVEVEVEGNSKAAAWR